MKDNWILNQWQKLYKLEQELFKLLSDKNLDSSEKIQNIYEKQNILIQEIIKIKDYEKIEKPVLEQIREIKNNFFELREKNTIVMAKILDLLKKEMKNIPKLKEILNKYSEDLKKKLKTTFDRQA